MILTQIKDKLRSLKNTLNYKRHWYGTNLSDVECLVIFMGNPRSGTTLVRSIIDAHPEAIIANELHILRLLKSSTSWMQIVQGICMNVTKFNADPVWTDYSYKIDGATLKRKNIRIIGDKRSAGTVHELMEHPELAAKLLSCCPVPIKIIRCVRNPYDVISTRTVRNGLSLTENMDRYFEIERNASLLTKEFKPAGVHYVYHEELINNTEHTIKGLLNFLNLELSKSLLNSYSSMIYKSPNLSRYKLKWSDDELLKAEEAAQKIPHLGFYLNEDQLVY